MATILHNKINQGSTAIKGSYVGAAPVKNAYQGSKLVYDVLDTTQYDTPTISLSYSTTPVVAKGGTLSPTLSYSQKWRYIGYSGTTYEQTAKTSGATTVTYTISGSGASIDSSGVVTWASRGTTIGNERSATVTVEVKMNGKSAQETFTVKQAGNYVTSISASGTSMSYTAINAGATSSAAPSVSTGTVTYTFSSTKTSTTAPSETYGSLTISKGFKIANKTTNGFTDINTSTGALTATSRGTTYGASNRDSATVTCTITYTWTPTSSYNAAGIKTITASPTAKCSQKPNLITALTLTNAAGGSITTPGTVTASGNSSLSLASASAASAGVTMTFSSESTSASYSDYVTLSISYAWSGGAGWATFDNGAAASQTVNIASRGTTYDNNTRDCKFTRTATITATLKSGYSNAAKASTTKTAEVTVTQAKNIITGVSVTVGAGTIAHSAGTVSAAAGEVSITNSASGSYSGTLTFSSTATAATSDTYGSWAASYSWSESDAENMLTWTQANATTMKVTVASRGTTFSTSTRSATMTRKYTATFTLNSTYDDGATSGTNNKSTSVTITQGANKIASISSVNVSAGSISYNSGNTVGAGGLTATTGSSAPSASAKVKLVSGSEITATSTHGSFTAGPTYSWSESDSAGMISFTSSNAATISVTTASRGTTEGAARSATLKRTASYTYTVTAANSSTGSALTKDGSGVASTTISQAKNEVTKTDTSYGSWSYNWTTTGNSTRTRTVTYTDTYSSGSTKDRSGNNQTETGGTRYIVLDSFSDGVSEGGTHNFGAGGGTITARTVSHDYWPDSSSGSQIQTVVITGVTTSCTGFTCTTSGSTVTIKAGSKGTTISDANSATLVSTKSGFNKRSYGTCKQAANARSLVSVYLSPYQPDSTWIVTVTNGNWNACPKTGGYVKARGYANYTHTSGSSLNDQKITDDASLTWSTGKDSWITNHSNGGYYIHNNTSTSARSSKATWSYTYGGVTKTSAEKTLSQAAGAKSYGSYVGTFSANKTTLGAGADSATITYGKVYRPWTWNGVSGSGGNEYYSGNVYVTCTESSSYLSGGTGNYANSSSSTTTCTFSKTTYGTNTVSAETATLYLRLGSTSGTQVGSAITIKTTANSKGGSVDHYTYSNMATAIGSGLTAGGGSAALTASATRTPQYKWTSGSYTAGSAGTVDITSSCTFAITHKSQSTSTSQGTHNNSLTNFSVSSKTLSHSSMGTYNGYDHVTVRATASGLSGISTASKSTSVYNGRTTKGGTKTYGNVTAGTITNTTIPASGTTTNYTATAGNGSQTYSITRKYYLYDSGSESTISNASSGSETVAPSQASISATAGSLGTTVKDAAIIKSQTVTWASKDGTTSKNKTGTMYIYQAANTRSIKSYGSWKTVSSWGGWADYDYPYSDTTGDYWASCSIGSGITAAGGSATVSKSAGHTVYKWKRQRRSGTQYRDVYYTYTSGSESTGTNESSQTAYDYQKVSNGSSAASDSCTIAIVSDNNSRFSLSGTTLSHSTMGTNTTTDTCTVRCTNSSSTNTTKNASVSVTNSRSYGVPTITASYSKQSIYGSSYANNTTRAKLTASVSVTDSWTSGSTAAGSASITGYTKVSGASDATVESNGNVAFVNDGGGTDVQADRSCVVRISARNNNDTSKTATKDVTAYQQVDSKAVGCTWNSGTTVSYPLAKSAANSTTVPSITMSCVVKTYWGFKGTTISQTTVITPAKITAYTSSYTSGTTFAYGNVETSTGKVTWTSANTGSYPRTTTVYLRIYATTNTSASTPYKQFQVTAGQNINEPAKYWCRITLTSDPGTSSQGVGAAGLWYAKPSSISSSATAVTSPPVKVTGNLPSSVGTSSALNSSTTITSINSGMVFTTSGYANPSTGGVGAVPSYTSPSSSLLNKDANTQLSMIRDASGTCAPSTVYVGQDISGYVCFRGTSGTLYWATCKIRLVEY